MEYWVLKQDAFLVHCALIILSNPHSKFTKTLIGAIQFSKFKADALPHADKMNLGLPYQKPSFYKF
jgi:hypothetical protein